jgi:apolipoprotein N-acyltransferase
MPQIATLIERLRQHRLAPLLALLLGALTPFSLSPYNCWPVALLTIGLTAELLRGQSAKAASWRAFCFGFGLWAYGASWLYVSIHDYGYTPAWLAIPMVGLVAFIMALFFAALGALHGRFFATRGHALGFTALFVLGEWLRSWLFTGFPWLFSGYAFVATPLAGYAPVLGIFGVSLAVVLTALGLFQLLREGRNAWKVAVMLGLVWLAGQGLLMVAWTQVSKTPFTVSIVQGNIPQEDKWQIEWRDKTIDIYRQLSEPEWGRDLVIWPEAALPLFYNEAGDVLDGFDLKALAGNSAFVTGIPYAAPGDATHRYFYYNSIIATGNGTGMYNKQRLVPFGEYIPLESVLRGALPFFDLPMSSFSWGDPDQPPLLVKNHALAPYICYEIAYPDLVRRNAAHADILATVSNDGWFGSSIGPHQHFQMVQMRALETGRQIISATNNGVSGVIDEKGRVTALAPQFKRMVLRANTYATKGLTPYVVMGNVPVLLLSALLLIVALRTGRQQG